MANDQSNKLISLETKFSSPVDTVDSLTKKCKDLEGRSRLNNVRVVGIPKGSEGTRLMDFMATLVQRVGRRQEYPKL